MTTQSPPESAGATGRASGTPPAAGTPPPPRSAAATATVIEPPGAWQWVNARELWTARELVAFLAWRDVKVRYKQTLFGVAWAVLQPLLMMSVFTVFFSRLAGVPSGGAPYPIFAFAGLLPWTFYSSAVAAAGNSVVGSERLITKIYFPRLSIPFAAVLAAAVDFAVAMVLLLVLMAWYGYAPGPGMLLVPVVLVPIVMMSLGVGTLLAALNVSYRDFRYVIPFLLQLWMFATPTVYMQVDGPQAVPPRAQSLALNPAAHDGPGAGGAPAGVDPSHAGRASSGLRVALALNPLTSLVGAFRAAVLGGRMPWAGLCLSSAAAALSLVVGCLYFRKVEDGFADVI